MPTIGAFYPLTIKYPLFDNNLLIPSAYPIDKVAIFVYFSKMNV